MAEMWSDHTDALLRGIDKQISNKYKVSMRDLLKEPAKYAAQPSIQVTISNMREDAEKYIQQKLDKMENEVRELSDNTARAESITNQLGQNISALAKQNRVPLIKPVDIERDETKEEHIYVDGVDASVVSLVEKLIISSNLVADIGTEFDENKIGSWLFSGQKNYVLSVFVPSNGASVLQESRDEILGLLDAASDFVRGL